MKVFVLMKCFIYAHHGEIDSIYSTNELAIKARSSYWIDSDGDGSTCWIDEYELDLDDNGLESAATK